MDPSSSTPSSNPVSSARSTRPLKSDPPIPVHDSDRPRTPQEAERFFRRVALENQPPSKTMRWLSIGGWVAGACKSFFPCFRERLILRNCCKPLGRGIRRSSDYGGLAAKSCLSCCTLRYIISCPDSYIKLILRICLHSMPL